MFTIGGAGAPRVVDVGGAVREPGAAMEQRRGRPSRHSRVTVGASGHHCLREAEHAAHAGDLVERRDEVHLRRARVGEAGIDAARQKRANQAFGSIHDNEAPRALNRPRTLARILHQLAPPIRRGSWTGLAAPRGVV